MFRRALVLVALCLATGSVCAQEAKYDLRKQPVFRPGDKVKTELTSDYQLERRSGGKLDISDQRRLRYSDTEEVLAVDAAGLPVEIRITVGLAELEEKDMLSKVTVKTSLRDISLIRKRKGDYFHWDSNSIVTKEPNALTAPQISLLKYTLRSPDQWGPYPQANVSLMPKALVAIGQTWEPDPNELKRWVENLPSSKVFSLKISGGRFKFISAQGQVATVEGNMATPSSRNGADVQYQTSFRRQIDTVSGRWTESIDAFDVIIKTEDRVSLAGGNSKSTCQFTLGTDKPSPAPMWSNKIGWAKASPDTNAYKDRANRFSLNVPAAYKPIEGKMNPGIVARFQSSDTNARILVIMDHGPALIDLDDTVPRMLVSMKGADKSLKVVKSIPLTLPNNVPAILFVDSLKDGSINGVTIVAADGNRYITVSLSAPSDQNVTVEDLSSIAKSLRILGPEDE